MDSKEAWSSLESLVFNTYQYGSQCGTGTRFHAVCAIAGGSIGSKNTRHAYKASANLTR